MSKGGARLLKLFFKSVIAELPLASVLKSVWSRKPDNDFDLLVMKMKLICIGKVLRLALSMHVLCAAPLMCYQSHVSVYY